VDIVTTLKTQ